MDLWPSFPIYSPHSPSQHASEATKDTLNSYFSLPSSLHTPPFFLPILVLSILFVFVSKCAYWQLNRFSFFRKGRNQKRVLEMKVFRSRSFETGGWEDLSSGREQNSSQRLHSILPHFISWLDFESPLETKYAWHVATILPMVPFKNSVRTVYNCWRITSRPDSLVVLQ